MFNVEENRTQVAILKARYEELMLEACEESLSAEPTTAKVVTFSQNMREIIMEIFELEKAYQDYLKDELAKKKNTAPDTNAFTIYWRDGKRSVIYGPTIEEAFTNAGYGGGAVAAIDWYDNGDTDTHVWVKSEKTWVKRNRTA